MARSTVHLHSSGLAEFCSDNGFTDIPSSGSFFTWCNQQEATTRMYCKLDRVMGNVNWMESYNQTTVEYIQKSHSDHTLSLLSIRHGLNIRRPPFKFLHMWTMHHQFASLVSNSWLEPVEGVTPTRVLIIKLQRLKGVLKQFNKEHFSDISQRVKQARSQYKTSSEGLQRQPIN